MHRQVYVHPDGQLPMLRPSHHIPNHPAARSKGPGGGSADRAVRPWQTYDWVTLVPTATMHASVVSRDLSLNNLCSMMIAAATSVSQLCIHHTQDTMSAFPPHAPVTW